MAPMVSVFHYRAASDASPVDRDEAGRIALGHAETLGLKGGPRGLSVHRMGWAYYNRLVGQWSSGMGGQKVWVVALTGDIERGGDSYPYMTVVLDLSGNIMSASFYPCGNPVPFPSWP